MKAVRVISTAILALAVLQDAYGIECNDRNAKLSAMEASARLLGGESFRAPVVLKRHHPSKRKEVATYFKRGDLYYTLFWLIESDCQAGFIKRTKGKY